LLLICGEKSIRAKVLHDDQHIRLFFRELRREGVESLPRRLADRLTLACNGPIHDLALCPWLRNDCDFCHDCSSLVRGIVAGCGDRSPSWCAFWEKRLCFNVLAAHSPPVSWPRASFFPPPPPPGAKTPPGSPQKR